MTETKSKTLTVKIETYRRLVACGGKLDSFDAIIRRLLDEHDKDGK